MSALKDDIEMLSDILQKGLTDNKATILNAEVKKDTAFLNIEWLLNDVFWGFYCYRTVEENLVSCSRLSFDLLRANIQSLTKMPEDMDAVVEVLSNTLTAAEATIVEVTDTKDHGIKIIFAFGDKEDDPFILGSYVSQKKQLQ